MYKIGLKPKCKNLVQEFVDGGMLIRIQRFKTQGGVRSGSLKNEDKDVSKNVTIYFV